MSVLCIASILGLSAIARLAPLRTPIAWGNGDIAVPPEPEEPAGHLNAGDWRIIFVRQLHTAQMVIDRLDASGVTEFECTALGPAAFVVLWRVPADGSASGLGLHIDRFGGTP